MACAEQAISTRDTRELNQTNPKIVSEPNATDVQILERDPDNCTWVEAKASVPFGEQDTKHQARAQAVSEARTKAMQRLLGVRLQHHFIDFQQESSLKGEVSLTEHLLRVTQLGRVLKEEILWVGPVDVKDCNACRFEAHIRACIVPLRDMSDRDFAVRLSLNRGSYYDGDEALITVTSTRDAYVYVFNVDTDWHATMIFPNDYARDNYMTAADTFVYPNESLRAKGVRSVARLPAGNKVSAEMIRVIASKVRLPALLLSPADLSDQESNVQTSGEHHGGGSFLSLMHKLNRTQVEWVEDAQAFMIQKR